MPENILFPVDLEHTDKCEKALGLVIDEARRSSARVTVLTAAPGFGMPMVASYFDEQAVGDALKEVARQLKKYVDANLPDDINVHPVVVEGNPAELILKQEALDNIDLIVLPSHNNNIEHILLGSVAAKVVRHSTCTVTVVK